MFDVVLGWFVANESFLIVGVLVISVLVGGLVEFSKKAWKALEEKYKADAEKTAKLKTLKAWVSQVAAAFLVVVFLNCVGRSEIGILGGSALLPLWFSVDYCLQYLVSCYGLKLVQKMIENKKNAPKVEKKHYVKAYRDPETGELVEG